MENRRKITNLAELNLEISRLKVDYKFKEIQLKQDANAYIHQFSPMNLIRKFFNPDGLKKLDDKTNISGNIMSMILPLLLNKTLFRGSGIITKAIGALISGKVGKSLDADSIMSAFNSVKDIFTSKRKKKVAQFSDYGIPPDSETF